VIKLDDDLLAEMGFQDLPPDHRRTILAALYEELEMRVGYRLSSTMSLRQIDEFEGFVRTNDEPGALAWLEAQFPDYREVVSSEFNKLLAELRAGAGDVFVLSEFYRGVELTPTLRPGPWKRESGKADAAGKD
jgi:hypothetical protein